MIKIIPLETKISYIFGFLFSSTSVVLTNTTKELLMICLTGFIGGFFGLVGKELFNYIKRKISKGNA